MFTSTFNAGNADYLDMKMYDVDKTNVDFSIHSSLKCLFSEFAHLIIAMAMWHSTIFFTALVCDNDTNIGCMQPAQGLTTFYSHSSGKIN